MSGPAEMTRRGPRGDLSRATLVAAAARVLDRDGLSGLTQRAVARQVGATPTVLYTYFRDMDDLRHAVGDDFISTWPLDTLGGEGSPRARVHDFLAQALLICGGRPRQAELLASQAVVGPASLALNEALLHLLSDPVPQGAGMGLLEAHDVVGILTDWFFGHLANELPAATTSSTQWADIDWTQAPLGAAVWQRAADRARADPGAARTEALRRICSLVPA